MREEDLKAIQPKTFKPKTTDSKGTTAVAANLPAEVNTKECAASKIIIGDITCIRLRGGGCCYLAVRQDKVTRRIIGWNLALEMTAALVIAALEKAVYKGKVQAGAIIHSDRGSRYGSNGFRELLRKEGLRQSMSGKGKGSRQRPSREFLFRIQSGVNRRRRL